jgi:DNA-binding response OmpR family regulator
LIVDESAESREVLRTLLEHHGATTLEARRMDQAIGLAESFHTHLIVVDAESDRSSTGSATSELREAASRNGTPIVILGTFQRARAPSAAGQFIAKPYHYGQLLRKIESLLAAG